MEIRKQKGKQVGRLTVTDKQHQEDLQRLRLLRPIDDDFMRCLFKDNIPLAEFVLRIITDKPDLIITDCETQKDMKRLAGARSICLDAYGTDSAGKKYDLEVQRQDKGADPHRARYHSSVMDIENLHSGQEFKELPDTYTIFIIEKDFYGQSEAVYPIERIILQRVNLLKMGSIGADCKVAGNPPVCNAGHHAAVIEVYDCAVIAHISVFQKQVGEIRTPFFVDFPRREVLLQLVFKYFVRFPGLCA